jgi:hypothetical protein
MNGGGKGKPREETGNQLNEDSLHLSSCRKVTEECSNQTCAISTVYFALTTFAFGIFQQKVHLNFYNDGKIPE